MIQGPTTFDGQNKAKFLMMLTGKQVDISIGERNGNGIAFNNAAGAAIVIGGGAAKITVDTCTFKDNLNVSDSWRFSILLKIFLSILRI